MDYQLQESFKPFHERFQNMCRKVPYIFKIIYETLQMLDLVWVIK